MGFSGGRRLRQAAIFVLAALALVSGALVVGASPAPFAPTTPHVHSTSALLPASLAIAPPLDRATPTPASTHAGPSSGAAATPASAAMGRSGPPPAAAAGSVAIGSLSAALPATPRSSSSSQGVGPRSVAPASVIRPLGTASLTANGQGSALALDLSETVTFSWSYAVGGGYVCQNDGEYNFCLYDMSDGDGGEYDSGLTDCTGSTTGSWADSYAATGTFTAGDPVGGDVTYNAYAEYEAPCEDGYVDAATFNTVSVTVNPTLTAPSTPSISAARLDANQVLTVQSTLPTTGTPNYAWDWLVSVNGGGFGASSVCSTNSGSGAGRSAVETCSVPANTLTAGDTYAFELKITDSANGPAETATTGNSATVTVYGPLTGPTTPSVSASKFDADQAFTSQSTLSSSGAPTYSYAWLASVNGGSFAATSLCSTSTGSGIAGGTLETCSVPADSFTAGDSYAFELQQTDTATVAETAASSPSSTITVYAPLSAAAVTPASPVIDSTQSILLTSHGSGGTPTVAYQWYSSTLGSGACTGGSPISLATSSTYTASGLAADTYFCYQATDSSGAGAETAGSGWDLVTVNGALEPGSVSPTSAAIDVGQSVSLTATAPSGGTPAYSYQWMSGTSSTCSSDTAVAGQTGASYAPVPASSTYYCVRYGDSASGTPASFVYSNVVDVTVTADPTVSVTPAGPIDFDVGQAGSSLTATVVYSGPNSDAVAWYSSATSSCSSSSTFTGTNGLTLTPSTAAAGTTYFCAVVSDGGLPSYSSASNAVKVVVSNDLSLSSIAEVSPVACSAGCAADAGQTLSVETIASQGTPGYTFSWAVTVGTAACSGSASGATTSVYTCSVGAISSSQTWTVTVYAQDAVGCYYPTSGVSCAGPPGAGQVLSFTVTLNPDLSVVQSPSTTQSNESGQTNNFTATASGGTHAYAYQWLVNGSAAQANAWTGANTARFVFHPAHPGTYLINVSVTDAAGFVAWTPGVSEVASPGPDVSLTASRLAVDVGMNVVLFGNYTGGSPPIVLTYTINGGAPVQSSGTLRDYNFSTAVSGTYVLAFTESDNQHSTATAKVTIVVNALPTIALTPSTPGVDVGQMLNVTALTAGGTSPLSCRWYVNGTLQPGHNCVGVSYTTSHAGPLVINATVVDLFGNSASSTTVTVQVQPSPSVLLTPVAKTVDAGQKVLFTSTITGGTPSFSCQWYENSTILAGATSCTGFALVPTHGGTYEVWVRITDSANPSEAAVAFANVTAGPALVPTLSPLSKSVDVGYSVPFSVVAAGGAPAYSYSWWVNGAQVSGTATSYTFSESVAGTYTVGVEVADANLNSVLVNATVVVSPLPTLTLSPSGTTETAVSTTVNFAATIAHGTGPFGNILWYVNGVYAGEGSTYAFTESVAATYIVNASVQDGDHNWAASADTTVVVTQLVAGGSGSTQTEAGLLTTYQATAKGGTAPYAYQWLVDKQDVVGATSASFSWTAKVAGTFNVSVQVKDSSGLSAVWGEDVVVLAGVQVSLTVGASALDVGMSSELTTSESGGLGPFTYTWTLDGNAWSGSSAPSSSGAPFEFTPSAAGTYSIQVEVQDSLKATNLSASMSVVVNAPPSVSVGANVTSLYVGEPVTLTATVVGGTSPFQFAWILNGSSPVAGTGATTVFAPLGGGTYKFAVEVTDSFGKTATSANVTITVSPNPAHGVGVGSGSTSGFPWWVLVLVVVAALAAVLLLVVMRRRRNKPLEDSAPMGAPEVVPALGGAAVGAAVASGGAAEASVAYAPAPAPTPIEVGAAYGASLEDQVPIPEAPVVQEVPRSTMSIADTYLPLDPAPIPIPVPPSPEPEEPPTAPQEPTAPPEPHAPLSYIGIAPVHPATQARGLARGGDDDLSQFPHCPRCGSPLPSARSECLVCASTGEGAAAGAVPAPAPEEPPAEPSPWDALPDRRARPERPAAPPPPEAATAPPPPIIPSSPEPEHLAPVVPIAEVTPAPPPTPVSPPRPSGERPHTCYVCGSPLDGSAVCPVCGIDWSERTA